jgi:hypothetical protein
VRPDEVWIAHSEVCGLRHKWDFGAGNPCDNVARAKKVKGCEAHRNETQLGICMSDSKSPECSPY